jgi:hypothetical protein
MTTYWSHAMFSVLSIITSLHIEFDEFNGNIITKVSAHPQFNVISCGIGQVLCKPWRVVELTACAGGYTALTIPENIIGVEHILRERGIVKATLTKEIISNKCRDKFKTMYVTRTFIGKKDCAVL